MVLPTGAFGSHFNLSDQPHSYYLIRELIKDGVPAANIYSGTVTSNTVQDCTEAWYRFKNGNFERLVAVTSDYHAERVAFILSRLSENEVAEIEVIAAETPDEYDGKDKQLEPKKVRDLKREWVNVIRRKAEVPPGRFVSVYGDAGREHQHYDTLSLAVISAVFVIDGFAFLVVPGKGGWLLALMLLSLALINALLWLLYNRMADAARTARRVMTRMEIEHRLPGFSSNWRSEAGDWYRKAPWLWSMKELITALAAVLFATLVIVALTAPGEDETATRTASAVANSNASPGPGVNTNSAAAGNALTRWSNRVLGTEDNANTNANANRRRRR